MTALNFPTSPSTGATHNAANGLQYVYDGVKWTTQGAYDSGAINAQKLDSIASSFNGSTTTFDLKVNGSTVKPHNEQSVQIVLAGHLQEPVTAYTINTTAGTITFTSAPAGGVTFFGVLLSRLPTSSGVVDGSVTNVKVADNAAIEGSKLQASSDSNAGTMSAANFTKLAGVATSANNYAIASDLLDEDNMSTNSATKVPSQQSVKAYVDTNSGEANVQSDWNQTTTNADDFIKNKPTIPAAQVSSDWNSSSGASQILNKPTIPAAYANSDVDSHLNKSTASNGQILSWTGSDYDWVDDNAGIASIADDSITEIKLDISNTPVNGNFLQTDGSGTLTWANPATTSVTASNINAAFGDTNQLILGNGPADNTSEGNSDNDDALVLYYGTGSGTNYGVISADNGVHIQYDGTNRLETNSSGTKWIGDLFCDDNQVLKIGGQAALKIYQNVEQNGDENAVIDATGDSNSNTGGLLFYAKDFIFHEQSTNTHRIADFAQDGGTGCRLYYNNGVRLQTTDNGITITGEIIASTLDISGNADIDGTLEADAYTVDGTALNEYIADTVGAMVGSNTETGITVTYQDSDNTLDFAVGAASGFDFNDEVNIKFGGTSGEQLKIYYNSTTNRGILNGDLGLTLQYNGSGKLETHNTGIKWFGDLYCDANGIIKIGNAAELKIRYDGTNSIIDATGETNTTSAGGLLLYAKEIIFHEESDHLHKMAQFIQDDAVILFHSNTEKFRTTSTGIDVSGNIEVDGTVDGVDLQTLNTAVSANTAKTTNATHSGEVTGATALTIADNVVDEANLKVSNSPTNGYVLTAQSGNTGGLTWSAAAAAETATTINALYPDDGNLILGTGTGSDTMKLYYNATNGGFITADLGVKLQFNGSTKFETTSGGAKWHGDLHCDDDKVLKLGSSADLQIYHDGTNGVISNTGDANAGNLLLYAPHIIFHEKTNITHKIAEFQEGANGCTLYYNNSKTLKTNVNYLELTGNASECNIQFLTTDGIQRALIGVTNSNSVIFRGGSEKAWEYANNGALSLYYDDEKKFETYASGTLSTGNMKCTGNVYVGNQVDGHAGNSTGQLMFGASNDLKVWHDGASAYTTNITGTYHILGDVVAINDYANEQNMIVANNAGNVRLYYDGGQKLETTSTGILVNDWKLEVKAPSAHSAILYLTGDAGAHNNDQMRITAYNGQYYWQDYTDASWQNSIQVSGGGSVYLYYDNTEKLSTQSSGVKWTGDLYCDDSQVLKLGSAADLQISHTGSLTDIVQTTGTEFQIRHSSTNGIQIRTENAYDILIRTNAEDAIRCEADGAVKLYEDGTLRVETTDYGAIVYSTIVPNSTNAGNCGASDKRWGTVYASNALDTSDRNEKNTIQPSDLGLNFINKLKPVSYKWNDTNLGNKTHYGLIAQDVEEVVISEGKTLNDFGGVDKPESDPMSLSYNELMAPMVKAIQELSAKVTALEAAQNN